MASEDSNTEIEEFMASPLVIWFNSCLEGIISHELTFEELVDGVLIYNVFLKMDIHGQTNDVAPPNNDHAQRLKNLETIMRNMRLFYEEDSVVLQEPELRLIARAAHSNLHDVELLLILLLGCAVKCPNNKYFIERITLLEQSTQEAIASHIGKVTHFPDVVLCRDMLLVETTDLDESAEPEDEQQQSFHTRKVYKAFEEIRRINKERLELIERGESAPPPNVPHCVLELNEWRAKAMQLKNIEDEYAHELHKCIERIQELERENGRLVSEAKAAKDYRDALDATMERALQAERLEQEVTRYKEKLEQLESCRSRLEELKQDNRLLSENKDELVAQLSAYKTKLDRVVEIEAQTYKLKEQCDKLALERDSFKEKLAELSNVNDELERRVNLSTSMSGALHSTSIGESTESLDASFDNSICEQLSRSTNSHALKLELENRRLTKIVESLQESSFHESSFKILDLEKEKKSLQLARDDLTAKAKSLEDNLAAANKEKMQLRVLLENAQKLGSNGSEMESKVATLESEKRKVLRELEKTRAALKEKLSSLEASSRIIQELQIKLKTLEKARRESDSGDELNSSILKSPPRSTILQNRLKNDLRAVTHERDALKSQVKDAQLKIKKLESDVASLQAPGSPNALRREFGKLKHDFVAVMQEYRKVKSQCDELVKQHGDDQLEMRAKNVRIIELDLQNTKLQHKCELLNQLNERAESDKLVLMDYVSQMLKQNQELVTQTLEDKEHYHEEERKNSEAVNNLSRAKEKLEEKIMDQFRRMDNRREVKKRSAAVSAVKNTFVKVRRAGSEFFGRSRRSWSDDNNSGPTEKSDDFEYARPSDAGIYANLQPRNRKSVDFMDDFEPENFSFEDKNNNC